MSIAQEFMELEEGQFEVWLVSVRVSRAVDSG
jgi:hypothetical protein